MSRIYLVDDHAIMRECLLFLLKAGGHTVVGESGNTQQALTEILSLSPDLVLLDIHLEGQSGFELLAELQRLKLPCRCIVLSSSAIAQHVADAIRLGAAGYVLKESASADLMNGIKAVMQGKKYLGAQVADLAARALKHPQQDDPLGLLSPRELQIMRLVVHGESSTKIGQALSLSPKTVATYRSRLMDKLGAKDVPALVRWAIGQELQP